MNIVNIEFFLPLPNACLFYANLYTVLCYLSETIILGAILEVIIIPYHSNFPVMIPLSVLHSIWPMISFHNNCPVFYTHTHVDEISPPIWHKNLVVKTMLL